MLLELNLIDGDFWNAGHVNAVEAAINSSSPAGTVVMSIAAAAPPGWLLLNGQVVVNAQTLYPDLWAAAPVAWRSGAALNLPNINGRFPMGPTTGNPVGSYGGADTLILAAANLPPHEHTGATGFQTAHHTHSPAGYLSGDQYVVQRQGGPNAFNINAGTGATIPASYPGSSIELDDGTGTNGNHQHIFSTNEGPGTSEPIHIQPLCVVVNFLVRAY